MNQYPNNPSVCLSLMVGLLLTQTGQAASVPDSRGKVILVIDQSMLTSPEVVAKLDRFSDDLVSEGWRVLRHPVERGVDDGTPPWAIQVKSIRALLKADYDAAPAEVKTVFLIGHPAIPYSGKSFALTGGHADWEGAHAADLFYGDMTSGYGCGGYTDSEIDFSGVSGQPQQFPNYPNDGRFDQNTLASAQELSVGRVDFSRMGAFYSANVNEHKLLARYFDKDHDFRNGSVTVDRRVVGLVSQTGSQIPCGPAFEDYVGPGNLLLDCATQMNWFPRVKAVANPFLLGYAWGNNPCGNAGGFCHNVVGTSYPLANFPQYNEHNFLDVDSRVVFVHLYASYLAIWYTENNMLRAALANPYDPSNQRFGWGLFASTRDSYPNGDALKVGGTIGDALLPQDFRYQPVPVIHQPAMGDPTLRLHPVPAPANLNAVISGTQVSLSWSPVPAASGYKIYRGPTRQGPFTLVQSVGAVNTVVVNRAPSSPPDTFYMVRAQKSETIPGVSTYDNLGSGAVKKLPGANPTFLQIRTQPANAVGKLGYPVALSIDALGIGAAGNETLTYRWYKGGSPVPSGSTRVRGETTRSLLITAAEQADAGSYSVTVSVDGQSVTSQVATLSIPPSVQATPDVFPEVSLSSVNYLDVLSNDVDAQHPLSRLEANSQLGGNLVGRAWPQNGKLAVQFQSDLPGLQNFFSQPSQTMTYSVSDGMSSACGSATVAALPILMRNSTAPAIYFSGVTHRGPTQALLYLTTDLNNWPAPTVYPLDGLGTFTLSNSFSLPLTGYRFVTFKANGVCAGNSLGGFRKSLPVGWSSFSMPLDLVSGGAATTANLLTRLFPSAGHESAVSVWSPSAGWTTLYFYDATQGAWIYQDGRSARSVELAAGQGVMFYNSKTSALGADYIGSIPKGGRRTLLAPGFSFIGSGLPWTGSLNSLGLNSVASLEDQVHFYNPATISGGAGTWDIFFFDGISWIDQFGNVANRTVKLGEGFFYFNAGQTTKTWIQTYACP